MSENQKLFAKALEEGLARRFEKALAEAPASEPVSPMHFKRMQTILRQKAVYKTRRLAILVAILAVALLLVGCAIVYRYVEYKNFSVSSDHEWDNVVFRPSESEEPPAEEPSAAPNTPPAFIEVPYKLSYVPENYALVSETKTPLLTLLEFENLQGEIIEFEQTPITKAGILVDNERGDITVLTIDDLEIYFYTAAEENIYIWTDGCYQLLLFSTIPIKTDDLTKIITGISS